MSILHDGGTKTSRNMTHSLGSCGFVIVTLSRHISPTWYSQWAFFRRGGAVLALDEEVQDF